MSVVRPSKIVCVGRNYRAHAQELGNELPATGQISLQGRHQHWMPRGEGLRGRRGFGLGHACEEASYITMGMRSNSFVFRLRAR